MRDIPGRLILKLAGAILIFLLLLFGIYQLGRVMEVGSTPETKGDLSERVSKPITVVYDGATYVMKKRFTNILFMGIDEPSGMQAEFSGFRGGGQADFLLLMVINHDQQTITSVQIDRDTMAEITVIGVLGNPAGTRTAQIALSHGFGDGGEQSALLTVDAVGKLFLGIPIDYYIAIDMGGISLFNDAIGGVTVTLEEDFSNVDQAMTKGTTLKLSGTQAEHFVRGRMGIGDGTNQSRMSRQRAYLNGVSAIFDNNLRQNANFIGDVFDAIKNEMRTDMTRGRMINEAWSTRDYSRKGTISPAGEHRIGDDGFMQFYPEHKAIEAIVFDLFFDKVSD